MSTLPPVKTAPAQQAYPSRSIKGRIAQAKTNPPAGGTGFAVDPSRIVKLRLSDGRIVEGVVATKNSPSMGLGNDFRVDRVVRASPRTLIKNAIGVDITLSVRLGPIDAKIRLEGMENNTASAPVIIDRQSSQTGDIYKVQMKDLLIDSRQEFYVIRVCAESWGGMGYSERQASCFLFIKTSDFNGKK